jgi:hypothetical protein
MDDHEQIGLSTPLTSWRNSSETPERESGENQTQEATTRTMEQWREIELFYMAVDLQRGLGQWLDRLAAERKAQRETGA